MKPRPRENYSVAARAFAVEYPEVADRMVGAYWVELNGAVTLAFVPRLPCGPEMLRWPDDVDVPATDDEAMAVVALSHMYVVVTDSRRAGETIRVVPNDGNGGAAPVIFFVGSDEGARLIADVRLAEQLTHGYQPSVHLRDEFPELASFVERCVVGSELLDSYSRALLTAPDRGAPRTGGAP